MQHRCIWGEGEKGAGGGGAGERPNSTGCLCIQSYSNTTDLITQKVMTQLDKLDHYFLWKCFMYSHHYVCYYSNL